MAVMLKLSTQDAKYLEVLCDAVSAATATREAREPKPPVYNKVELLKAIRTTLVGWFGQGAFPTPSDLTLAQAIERAIVPHMAGSDPAADVLQRRAQVLMNALPFSEWAADHRFALRIGLSLNTARKIAEERENG